MILMIYEIKRRFVWLYQIWSNGNILKWTWLAQSVSLFSIARCCPHLIRYLCSNLVSFLKIFSGCRVISYPLSVPSNGPIHHLLTFVPSLLDCAKEERNWDGVENVVEQANVDWEAASNRELHRGWQASHGHVHNDDAEAGQVLNGEDDYSEPNPRVFISEPEPVVRVLIPHFEDSVSVAYRFSHAANHNPSDDIVMLKWRKIKWTESSNTKAISVALMILGEGLTDM